MENKEEFKRLINLSDFNLDYENLEQEFIGMNRLAAEIANSEVSQLNFIDNFVQWSVSQVGTKDLQTPRAETICTYTVDAGKPVEVKDLSKDPRFKNIEAIKAVGAKYYFGIPLISKEGYSIGSLCVISLKEIQLNNEKKEMLSLIADEIVRRLEDMRSISRLKEEQHELRKSKREVAHDLRGMINGISGLGDLISLENEGDNKEIEKYIKLLKGSSSSMIEYVERILASKSEEEGDNTNIELLSNKLERLYLPLAIKKDLNFTVTYGNENSNVSFEGKTILQVIGNLVSNAMKFTPKEGEVSVSFDLIEKESTEINDKGYNLKIIVQDSGIGMDEDTVESILTGQTISTEGTQGEGGYGLGLNLVKHHVNKLNGSLSINSKPNEGTSFTVEFVIN